MKAKIKIPKMEQKANLIGLKLTDSELNKVKSFCTENKVSQTFLLRFALEQVIPNFKN